MRRMSGWFGGGVLTAGLSAAMIAGAGAASANAETDNPAGPTGPSASSEAGGVTVASTGDRVPRLSVRDLRSSLRDLGARGFGPLAGAARPTENTPRKAALDHRLAELAESAKPVKSVGPEVFSRTEKALVRTAGAPRPDDPEVDADAVVFDAAKRSFESTAAKAVADIAAIPERVRAALDVVRQDAAKQGRHLDPAPAVVEVVGAARERLTQSAAAVGPLAVIDAAVDRVLDPIGQGLLIPGRAESPQPLSILTTVFFTFYSALTRVLEGPPAIPPNLRGSVQVSSSTLVITKGHEVPADWYIPIQKGDEPAPDRLIYLQHGFLANGPMYSYTAANLAERTNSIVVVTSLTSNPFAEDGIWLGGDAMHKAVAGLFLDDDRKALNASLTTAALKAGREVPALPEQFVLVGHSLGGGFAPGVAGHYAAGLLEKRQTDPTAANDLKGVVVYDAVPVSPIMPRAMQRLKALEDSNDGPDDDYIPVYEIGAPLNYLNIFSDINDELSDARPGQFVGVVLEGGAHMDSMQGGNPIIQVAAYLVAGWPQPQNPPAVQNLSVGWINDMFEGRVDSETGKCEADCEGQYAEPGQEFSVDTNQGNATAVVIDSRPGAARPGALTQLVSTVTKAVTGALLGAPSSPGPGVTVGHSELALADGATVDADWYFPDTDEPAGVIYLQHGFFRSNDNVSALAADLARSTNSIVVAPSVSSNFLSSDGAWINGVPTQRSVAALFGEDRTALNQSAARAGYSGELPTSFVLAGHSAGGNLVTGAAGYLAASGADLSDFKGVVLLDAVDNGGTMQRGLQLLEPTGIPVYQIAAQPCACNAFGSGTDALVGERGGQFVGVRLVGGSHVDPEGVNSGPLASLVCGSSQPRNTAAVPTLAAGWINDMLADRISATSGICETGCTGTYGEAGESLPVGAAVAVVIDSGTAASVVRSATQLVA